MMDEQSNWLTENQKSRVAPKTTEQQRAKLPKHRPEPDNNRCGKVLAYVFGTRKDEVFLQLKALLEPFGINHFYTDGWGAYEPFIDGEPAKHQVHDSNSEH